MFDILLGICIGIAACIWKPNLPTIVHTKVKSLVKGWLAPSDKDEPKL